MEKNRFLDTYYRALALIGIAVVLSSCSFLKISILHDPLTPEEHINLGVSYEHIGELDAALREYNTASKKLPIAYLYMGNIYFRQNTYENAEKYYKKAIKQTQDPRAYNNLAWLYCLTDTRLQEAENLAQKAVGLSPDSSDFKDTLHKITEKRKQKP